MASTLENFIEELKQDISATLLLKGGVNSPIFNIVLNAYNAYQQEEKDGVDYLFNIYNQEDLLDCVRGGLSAPTISDLVTYAERGEKTPYFFFGCNHTTAKQFITNNNVVELLVDSLDDLVPVVLAYSFKVEEYGELYEKIISQPVLDLY